MSLSNAAAIKRRAPKTEQPKVVSSQPGSTTQAQGQNQIPPGAMTIQQVVAFFNNRIISLEQFRTDAMQKFEDMSSEDGQTRNVTFQMQEEMPTDLAETVEEFDKRYQMLAEEIQTIKNMVLSLQSYTMDVNKMLLEERNRLIAEIEIQQQQLNAATGGDSSNEESLHI
jgi:hypothetical protein